MLALDYPIIQSGQKELQTAAGYLIEIDVSVETTFTAIVDRINE